MQKWIYIKKKERWGNKVGNQMTPAELPMNSAFYETQTKVIWNYTFIASINMLLLVFLPMETSWYSNVCSTLFDGAQSSL